MLRFPWSGAANPCLPGARQAGGKGLSHLLDGRRFRRGQCQDAPALLPPF